MTETETSETPNMKKLKQTISIPFIWEERPGTPKKDWKPSTTTRTTMTTMMTVIKPPIETPPPPPLVKLIASVPFQWEEKLGKPLPSFSQSVIINTLPQADIISPLSPPRYSEDDDDNDDDNSISCDDIGNDELDKMWESEIESFESFSSAPSLLANGLVSSFAISRAVPVVDDISESGQLKSPGSPVASEAGSSTSSYATGTTSLAGSSFLEWLFPSLITSSAAAADHATLPGKVGDKQEKNGVVDQTNLKVRSEDLDRESNSSVVVRRASTLGELIMMSRRRSYHRKALQMMKRNPSMEFMKKNVFGCGIFQGSNGSSGLHQKWKKQFQLKIM